MVGVETDQPSAGLAAEEFALGDHRCGDRTGGSGHPSLIIERRSQAVSAGSREYEVAGIAVLRFRLFRDQNVGGTAQNFASASGLPPTNSQSTITPLWLSPSSNWLPNSTSAPALPRT